MLVLFDVATNFLLQVDADKLNTCDHGGKEMNRLSLVRSAVNALFP